MVEALSEAGLSEVRITQRFDCFRGTSKEGTAKQFGVRGANVFGRKPR